MKLLKWIFELIGLRKVIRFKQLSVFTLNEMTTEKEIRKYLQESSNDAQFHVGVEHECPESDKCGIFIIQKDPLETDYYFICKTVPFGITAW